MRTVKTGTACWRLSLLALGAILGSAVPSRAAEPQLVRDMEPRRVGEEGVTQLATVAGKTFFSVRSTGVADASGLWVSDGTASGTFPLPSPAPTVDRNGVPVVRGVGRLFFYYVYVEEFGVRVVNELWRSDGTVAGTFRLTESEPDSVALYLQPLGPRLFFTNCVAVVGCEPWISDGSLAGTHILRDISPTGSSHPEWRVPFQGKIYFLTVGENNVRTLWRSDGTRPGTEAVSSVPPNTSRDAELFATSDHLYLRGPLPPRSRGAGYRLYVSDGTAAGFLPVPPFLGPRPPGPTFLKPTGAVEGTLYFVVVADGGARYQLWRTDNSRTGTRQLLDLGKSPGDAGPPVALRGRDYFFGPGKTLWSIRGTARGTAATASRVPDCRPRCAPLTPLRPGGGPEKLGDLLLFLGADAGSGVEPWVSDGTAAGTHPLADLCPGACSSAPALLGQTADGIYLATQQGALWLTDGTPVGTVLLSPGRPGEAVAAVLAPATAALPALAAGGERETKAGTVLAFARTSPARGSEIWRTDGTPAGTYLLRPIGNGGSSSPTGLTALGDGVLFSACNRRGISVWTSHGAAADTIPLVTARGSCASPIDREIGIVNRDGAAYFGLSTAASDPPQVWRSDGTPAGTRALTAFTTPSFSAHLLRTDFQGGLLLRRDASIPELLRIDPENGGAERLNEPEEGLLAAVAATASRVFYSLFTFDNRSTIWTSDGSPAGTVLLAEFASFLGPIHPNDAVDFEGETIVLLGGDGGALWRSDGTPAGTSQIYPPFVGPRQLDSPYQVVAFRDSLLILSLTSDGSVSLLRSDGSDPGTATFRTFGRFEDPLADRERGVVLDGFFYFVAPTPEIGEELWRSDGTAEGTALVRDIAPGPAGSKIQALRATGGRLAFSADDGVHGAEPWISDGTAAGTRLAGNVGPGAFSSSPTSFAAAGGWLYFSSDDGVHGRELWKVALATAGAASVQSLHP